MRFGRVALAFGVLVGIQLTGRAMGAAREVAGSRGAAKIAFNMPLDGQATLALYTREGRLVRILGQMLPLSKGDYEMRWDGMDLWGNLVPAETALVAKVFTNAPLKAYYEFTVGNANPTPWLTRPEGEGMAMRTGGWMGDHSPPQSACVVGEKIFFGCGVAEHGHAMIATDLEGNKLWGINGLEGWSGPSRMASDGKSLYCDAKGKNVWKIDAATYAKKKVLDTGEDSVAALGYDGAALTVVLKNAKGEFSTKLIVDDKAQDAASVGEAVAMAGKFVLTPTSLKWDGPGAFPGDRELKKAASLAVTRERILIGDLERHAVLVFDRAGKLLLTIGDKGPRKAGPWEAQSVERPSGIAVDKNGKIWVAESNYIPKRVARFSAEGKIEKEFFGPAEYGGGGYLDSNLKRFYYRSMDYALDFEKGTWRLANLLDRCDSPLTPAPEGGTFTYTTIGRPIYVNGHRYLVSNPERGDGYVVTLLDDGMTSWRACAVMHAALDVQTDKKTRARTNHLPTFLKKAVWAEHWQKQLEAGALADKAFIWCDRNGDGQYQLDEVELFDAKALGGQPFNAPFFGNWVGPDLTLWTGKARLAPSGFTDKAVPIFEAKAIQPFDYAKLAPVYRESFSVRKGATANAKPDYGGTSIIAADGSLVLEAQPYVVKSDMTLKGGALPDYMPPLPKGQKPATAPADGTKVPSEYVPKIAGTIMDQPLHFVGTAMTRSPVGEVTMLNGNNGQWFVFSCQDRVLLGSIFTGADGSWSTGLKPERGMDVTGRKQDWECFFGYFTKARDDRFYVVAGHTFHAISRVEGLNDYKVQEIAVKVSREALVQNVELRPRLIAAEAAASAPEAKDRKTMAVRAVGTRGKPIVVDGQLADWGDKSRVGIGEGPERLSVDAAYNDEGLLLAYSGVSPVGNNSDDPRFLFKTGFCFDMMYRVDSAKNTREVIAGDRRIVFGQHQGKWVAMLYDYVDPTVPGEKAVQFSSPLITTSVARVVQLGADDVKIAFVQGKAPEGAPKGAVAWSAEVFVRFSALKLEHPTKVRADFGILTPDSGGLRVEKRTYWSNRATEMVADLGMEAQIQPGNWGVLSFE